MGEKVVRREITSWTENEMRQGDFPIEELNHRKEILLREIEGLNNKIVRDGLAINIDTGNIDGIADGEVPDDIDAGLWGLVMAAAQNYRELLKIMEEK